MPNITQDHETGIGTWSATQIRDVLSSGKRPDGTFLRTQMPWLEYSGLSSADTDALVSYVRGIKPVKNRVPRKP